LTHESKKDQIVDRMLRVKHDPIPRKTESVIQQEFQ